MKSGDGPIFASVADIRPLFRPRDVSSIGRVGFDLASYDDVSAQAEAILDRLRSGTMPSDGAWPVDQILLFAEWQP